MSKSVCILGRQTGLARAELESLFGAQAIEKVGEHAILVDVPPHDLSFSRIGGSTRTAKLLTTIPSTDWNAIENYLAKELPKHVCCLPEGKIRFGLSVYGLSVNPRKLQASGLTLKKIIKSTGRSVRVVPNKALELNSAQVLHNQMTGPTGMELLLIRHGKETLLAQTTHIQDIEAYAARDQARPKRDARVGMLPPKLAQIILNLAINPSTKAVLDPFCGTGVVMQEALLMGYDAYGTDIEERMIDYSEANLSWLETKHNLDGQTYLLEAGDATSFTWQTFDTIAGETYLGRPFSVIPKPEVLREVMQDVDTIHKKFLRNVARQTKPGLKLCIAVPAWKTKTGFKHLKTLDSLEELGYTRLSFAHAVYSDLIYHRENQIVGRELVVLKRI